MSENVVETKTVETKKSKLNRIKSKALKHKTALCVAASAVAAGGAAYLGTQKALQNHAVDVYFKVADEVDSLTPDSEETHENNE